MQHQSGSPGGHTYPAITLGDASYLHAGDLHIYEPQSDVKSEHKCHQDFKTSTYEDFKNRNIDRAEGTCQWVLTHPHFRSWRDGTAQNLLWISADPGCGKSVLAKALVDQDLNQDGLSTICYFFFKDNENQDNLVTALCAILHQLFAQQPDLIRHALPAWYRNSDKLRKEAKEMWRILQSCMFDPAARPIICVLDALDECRDADRPHLISLLCNRLTPTSCNPFDNKSKFLVTSRPYDNVQRWFAQSVSEWPHIRLRGEDHNDQIRREINLVINQAVQTLAHDLSLSLRHQEQLRQQLLSMQHRTYLWLYLAIEDIRETYESSLYPEQEEIESLPSSVEQAYEAILQRISIKQQPVARKILLIIAGARRPLKIGEMALALAAANPQQKSTESLVIPQVKHLEKQIREWCGLFVFIQSSTLFLIHQTAKEFLLSDQICSRLDTSTWRGSFSSADLETGMAKLCVTYLCVFGYSVQQREVQQQAAWPLGREIPVTGLSVIDEETNFTEYCLEHWISHFEDHMAVEDPRFAEKIMKLYDLQSTVFNLWFMRFLNTLRRGYDWLNALTQHAAALTGHRTVLDTLHNHNQLDIDALDGTGSTALWYAANQGHLEVVERLLDLGASIDLRSRPQRNTLYSAAENGYSEITQLLIDRGAVVNRTVGFYGSALHVASARGHEDVVQILINAGASMNSRGNFGATALHLALENGFVRVAKVLIEHGANIEIEDDQRQTAFYLAASHGHEELSSKLLETGTDASRLLLMASRHENLTVLEMTFEKSADINYQGEDGRNALMLAIHAASRKIADMELLLWKRSGAVVTRALAEEFLGDYLKPIKLLLTRGADVHARDKDGNDALFFASTFGAAKIAMILLRKGANVHSRYGACRITSLIEASSRGHSDVVNVLLDEGADVNATDVAGWTALHEAACGGHEEVVKLLLARGAHSDCLDTSERTALHEAAMNGHNRVVQKLLDGGAYVDYRDRNNCTALYAAAGEGHETIAQILLDGGAYIHQSNTYGETALHLAARQGHRKVVQTLLDRGAYVNQQSKDHDTALHHAAAYGHKKVSQILLNNGADVNQSNVYSETALHLTARGGHTRFIQILAKGGAHINHQNQDQNTALHYAAEEGNLKVVRLLLKEGADIRLKNTDNKTALDLAIDNVHQKVVQVLFNKEAKRLDKAFNADVPCDKRDEEGELHESSNDDSHDTTDDDDPCHNHGHDHSDNVSSDADVSDTDDESAVDDESVTERPWRRQRLS